VVDDDPLLAKTIDLCLSKRGHKVHVFHSGAGAVKHLFEEAPDLIVTDIRLPDCEGWFIAQLLEKMDLPRKIPLIIISVLDPDRSKVAATRPQAYIQKPFDMGQLILAVEKSLGQQYLPAA